LRARLAFRRLPGPLLTIVIPALAAAPAAAATWHVLPDGSGDVPTIAAGLDSAAAGDTVLVACGTYLEHDLLLDVDAVLRGETGRADCVTVDAQRLGRGLLCVGIGPAAAVEGITFANGLVTGTCPDDPGTGSYCMGGGMLCLGASPRVTGCVIAGNESDDNGGGAAAIASSPAFTDCEFRDNVSWVGAGLLTGFPPGAVTLTRCVFRGNAAAADGGAIYAFGTALTLTECTLSGNSAGECGGGVFWISADALTVDRTIIAFSGGGAAVACGIGASVPSFTCSDLYGNAGGDWTGCIAAAAGLAGNLSADPRFCAGEVTLDESSPCAGGAGGCGRIGARDVACRAVGVEAGLAPTSWGRLKVGYRGGSSR
jgi:predicted outer membrane repeat protein